MIIDTYTVNRYKGDVCTDIYAIISKNYSSASVIVRKAYYFAAGLLMKPNMLMCDNGLVYDKRHYRLKNYERGSDPQVDREHLTKCYPNYVREFNEICAANKMGLLMSFMGGHTGSSLELLLKDGYRKRVEIVLEKKSEAHDAKRLEFYHAELIVLTAAQKKILQYADQIEQQSQKISKVCRSIAYRPPKSFLEAVQLIIFTHEFCRMESGIAGSQGVRIDQLLYPYYLADKESGKITRHGALDILCSLWRYYTTCGERCANFTLGGSDKYGNDMCNEMTLLCMEASMRIKADVPLITLRVHPKLKDEVWAMALKLVESGQGFPAFYNDIAAVKAKINAGVTQEDAWDYSTLGCVELTIGGREYSHTEAARINWLKLLELMLFDGTCPLSGESWTLSERHDLEEVNDFAQFYEWYKTELIAIVHRVANYLDKSAMTYSECWPMPFLSSITYGCLENGSDITDRGTKYYNLSINCVGMANTVDSLEAIEKLVYQERKYSFEELRDALQNNFDGYGDLRRDLLACPKYGNDIESVDSKMSDLMALFSTTVHNEKMIDDRGKYQCGFYSVMHHALMGEQTGASLDGRMAKMSLANSLSPSQGMDVNGPTAVMNSICRIPMDFMGNGGALDLKFLPSFFQKKSHREAFRNMIEVYFEAGGLEVQFNVVDRETLVKAQKEPESYRNLVVRVSGYSAYFVKLEKALQDEIIMRTENAGV